MAVPAQQVFLVRHGETEWSLNGRHTGTTDIPLTENGRQVAKLLLPILAKESFALALTSPLQRARDTCRLAGFGDAATIEADLVEWNYGRYEGLTPAQIHATAPGWLLFRDGGPGGEQPGEIGARVDRVIEKRGPSRAMLSCSPMGMCLEFLRLAGWAFLLRKANAFYLIRPP